MEWVPIVCHFCSAHLKIKAQYAHLRGRCPDCGVRIEAPRRQAAADVKYDYSDNPDEPVGLVPLEDEWPEPALHERGEQDRHGTYQLAEGPIAPTPAPAKPVPAAVSAGETFKLGTDWNVPPQLTRPAPAVAAAPPLVAPIEEEQDRQEVFTLLPDPHSLATKPTVAAPVQVTPPPAAPVAPKPPPAPIIAPDVLDPHDVFQERAQAAAPPVAPVAASAPSPPLSPSWDPVPEPGRSDKPKKRRPKPEVERKPKEPEPPSDPNAPMASFAPPERVLTDRQDDKVEAHSPYQLSDAELRPERESGPLKRPLTEGVLSFPFKACNVKPMIFLTFGFMVFGLQCALLNLILTNGGMFAAVAGGAMAIGMLWVVILTGSYACSVMVEVIQQTAAGNRTITYDGYEWRSGFFSFLRVAWVAFLGVALPGFALSLCLSWWPVIGIAPATFPVALLSSMATDSWIKLWDSRLMAQAFKKPHVIMATYLYGVVMAGLVAGAGYLSWTFALFAPVFGILCATCWLIYSLVLGRVGDVLTTGEARKRRRKKKRKKPGTDGAEGVGGTEGEQGSALEENAAKAEAKEPEPPETGQSHVKS